MQGNPRARHHIHVIPTLARRLRDSHCDAGLWTPRHDARAAVNRFAISIRLVRVCRHAAVRERRAGGRGRTAHRLPTRARWDAPGSPAVPGTCGAVERVNDCGSVSRCLLQLSAYTVCSVDPTLPLPHSEWYAVCIYTGHVHRRTVGCVLSPQHNIGHCPVSTRKAILFLR